MLFHKIVKFLCQQEVIEDRVILRLFFKDIKVVGLENIPKQGAIILYGNHSNLFFDAILINAFSSRRPRFLTAQITHKQKLMGFFSRNLQSIPIKRPMDTAKKGSGYIEFISPTIVNGIETKFRSQTEVKQSLYVNHRMDQTQIATIESDTRLLLRHPGQTKFEKGQLYPYKILRKLDFKQTFAAVWKSLNEQQSLLIFPEGASHDQTKLIPLKQGIAISALGAMKNYPGLKIKLVPCGLKYFKPHQFRSKAILQFGEPYQIDPSILNQFKQDPQEAMEKAMKIIENRLQRVMLISPSYKELEAIIMARSIYLPLSDKDQEVDPEVLNKAYKKFQIFYNECYTNPEVQELFSEIKDYVKRLRVINIKDYEVRNAKRIPIFKLLRNTLYSLFMLVFTLTFVRFSHLEHLGIASISTSWILDALRGREKKKNYTRVKGFDVIASQKLTVGVVFYPLQSILFYIILFFFSWIYLEVSFILSIFLSGALVCLWSVYSYLCIISCDTLLYHYRLLRFRIVAILCRNDLRIVKRMRDRLKNQLERLIKKNKVDYLLEFKETEEKIIQRQKSLNEEWYRGLEAEEFYELMKEA